MRQFHCTSRSVEHWIMLSSYLWELLKNWWRYHTFGEDFYSHHTKWFISTSALPIYIMDFLDFGHSVDKSYSLCFTIKPWFLHKLRARIKPWFRYYHYSCLSFMANNGYHYHYSRLSFRHLPILLFGGSQFWLKNALWFKAGHCS
jgi:hypothetical protein